MTDKEYERILDEVAGEIAGEPAEDTTSHIDPRFTETRTGPTPNGGDYSVAYYYDEEGNPCTKAEASAVNIIEYNKEGSRINECYGVLK